MLGRIAHDRSPTNVEGEGDGDTRQATSGGAVGGTVRHATLDGNVVVVELFEEVEGRVLGPCPSIPPSC